MGRSARFPPVVTWAYVDAVKVSRATETTGPIGVVIEVDATRADADGVVTIALSGDLDVFAVPRLRAALRDHIGRHDVVIDLSGVEFCDSSVLRAFVEGQQASKTSGTSLELTNLSAPVRNLFEVSGLRGVLHIT